MTGRTVAGERGAMKTSTLAPVTRTSHPVRTAAAWAFALLTPGAAWLLWILPVDGYPGDGAHVGWFATVAAGGVLAGLCAPNGTRPLVALWVTAVAATLTTLFFWWGSEDESGMFMVGIIFATPLVAGVAPLLLGAGRGLRELVTRRRVAGRGAHA